MKITALNNNKWRQKCKPLYGRKSGKFAKSSCN